MESDGNCGKRLRYLDWTPEQIKSRLCDGMCNDNGFGVFNVGVLSKLIDMLDIKFVRECMLLCIGTSKHKAKLYELRQSFKTRTIRDMVRHAKHLECMPKEYVRVFGNGFNWADLRICDERREDLEAVFKVAARDGWCLTYKMLTDGIKYFEYRYKNIDEGYTNEICDPKRETSFKATQHARVSYKNGVWYLVGVTNRVPDRSYGEAYRNLKEQSADVIGRFDRYIELVNHREQRKKQQKQHKNRRVTHASIIRKYLEECAFLSKEYERVVKAYQMAVDRGFERRVVTYVRSKELVRALKRAKNKGGR